MEIVWWMSRGEFEAKKWEHPPEEMPSWDEQCGLEYRECSARGAMDTQSGNTSHTTKTH